MFLHQIRETNIFILQSICFFHAIFMRKWDWLLTFLFSGMRYLWTFLIVVHDTWHVPSNKLRLTLEATSDLLSYKHGVYMEPAHWSSALIKASHRARVSILSRWAKTNIAGVRVPPRKMCDVSHFHDNRNILHMCRRAEYWARNILIYSNLLRSSLNKYLFYIFCSRSLPGLFMVGLFKWG